MKKIILFLLLIPSLSFAADCNLANILAWKYGYVAGTRQVNPLETGSCPEMYISSWKHATISQPDDAQLIIDYAEYAVGGIREEKKAEVHNLAGEKVLAIVDIETQRNYTAKALELTERIATGGTLDAGQQATMDAIKAVWAAVKAVRVAEALIKAELDAIVEAGAMSAYDVQTNALWP